MLVLLTKVGALLPVLAALNVVLGAIGSFADAISKAQGRNGASKVGAFLGKTCAVIKKVIDVVQGNIQH